MSNYGPGSGEEGRFEHACAECGAIFCTNYPRQRYCSNVCKRRAQNVRHFERHQEQLQERARARWRRKRGTRST